jgi:hypothetical protein
MKKRGYGIWYDGGGFDNGWLHYEGRHAHTYRCEYDSSKRPRTPLSGSR